MAIRLSLRAIAARDAVRQDRRTLLIHRQRPNFPLVDQRQRKRRSSLGSNFNAQIESVTLAQHHKAQRPRIIVRASVAATGNYGDR